MNYADEWRMGHNKQKKRGEQRGEREERVEAT